MNAHSYDRHTLYQGTPASPVTERWRDATPLGNGLVGALVMGGIGHEEIIVTRGDLWQGGGDEQPSSRLPDLRNVLGETRALMDAGRYAEANSHLWARLAEKGYGPGLAAPAPLGSITLDFAYGDGLFSDYRRALHMDTAESEISFRVGSIAVSRCVFVSRADGRLWGRVSASDPVDVTASVGFCHAGTAASEAMRPLAGQTTGTALPGTVMYARPDDRGRVWGCVLRVIPDGSDADVPAGSAGGVPLHGVTGVTFAAEAFRADDETAARRTAARIARRLQTVKAGADAYASAQAAHRRKHGALYSAADIRLSSGRGTRSNEALLAEAFDGQASPELIEKLWRFGRYLFICGTAEGGLPFPLYGLWAGDYNLMWSQYVANENVQMCAWTASVGGLGGQLKSLIDFYYEKMPAFRENARLFGCRGILASVYTTPFDGHLSPAVPVILHYTTAAGWLCRHFFEYCDMTGDEDTLRGKVLPFAVEAAAFIEDYAVIENGRLRWYPSVSPENTPLNHMKQDLVMGHPMPTTENATMEVAIVKELLTKLIAVCSPRGLYPDRLPGWQRLLDAIPPYAVNADGAVREWQSEAFEDNYVHRHLSHVYPLFPGEEIGREHPLFAAFGRAVDLRVLGGSSGWSQAHMAAIYARLGRGERVMDCLDVLTKTCLLPNLFTVHNDWRESGMTLRMDHPPVQLDALLGAANAVQMMLLDRSGGVVRLLPALPARLSRGEARGLCFPGGRVDIRWDTARGSAAAVVHADRELTVTIEWPDVGQPEAAVPGGRLVTLTMKAGESVRYDLNRPAGAQAESDRP